MRHFAVGAVFILVATIGNSSRVTAQSPLSPEDTREETALVRFPSQNAQVVRGLIVLLPKSVKYEVSAKFESTAKNGHVLVYKPSSKVRSGCLKQECWEKLVQLSKNKESWDNDLDSKITKIFVTSWTPSNTDMKIALPDEYKRVSSGSKLKSSLLLNSDFKKGIKITFESNVGITSILITPR